jgi:hypothetical protein
MPTKSEPRIEAMEYLAWSMAFLVIAMLAASMLGWTSAHGARLHESALEAVNYIS